MMRSQTRQTICYPARPTPIRRGFCPFFHQNIFTSVNGMPFPAGVTGMVAQSKPNTQPEETE